MESNFHFNIANSRDFFKNIDEKSVIKTNNKKLTGLKDEILKHAEPLRSSTDSIDISYVNKADGILEKISDLFGQSVIKGTSHATIIQDYRREKTPEETEFLKLRKSGTPKDLYEKGLCYEMGLLGVKKNDQLAFKYIHQASKAGHRGAQRKLGEIYEYGELGQTKDWKKAVELYKVAAAKGDILAATGLDRFKARAKRAMKNPKSEEL